jgi:hypothetical protein
MSGHMHQQQFMHQPSTSHSKPQSQLTQNMAIATTKKTPF